MDRGGIRKCAPQPPTARKLPAAGETPVVVRLDRLAGSRAAGAPILADRGRRPTRALRGAGRSRRYASRPVADRHPDRLWRSAREPINRLTIGFFELLAGSRRCDLLGGTILQFNKVFTNGRFQGRPNGGVPSAGQTTGGRGGGSARRSCPKRRRESRSCSV